MFHKSIRGDLLKTWYTQNLYDTKIVGVNTLVEAREDLLATTVRERKVKVFIKDLNYDILTSQKYMIDFQFELVIDRHQPEDQERDEEGRFVNLHKLLKWRMSDFVTKVMNLDRDNIEKHLTDDEFLVDYTED
jgi:hypothetical protein